MPHLPGRHGVKSELATTDFAKRQELNPTDRQKSGGAKKTGKATVTHKELTREEIDTLQAQRNSLVDRTCRTLQELREFQVHSIISIEPAHLDIAHRPPPTAHHPPPTTHHPPPTF